MPGIVVAVEGPSGSGKTTAVRETARQFGWVALPEAYARLRPPPRLDFSTVPELDQIERRLLGEDSLRFVEARRSADGGATVLADTGFLGPLTYTRALVQLGLAPPTVLPPLVAEAAALAERDAWGLPDLVLWLRTTEPTRLARARSDPRGHPSGLDSRHAAVGREEHAFYRDVVASRFPGLVRTVSGSGTPSGVAARVRREVERARPAPHSPGALASLLAAISSRPGVP